MLSSESYRNKCDGPIPTIKNQSAEGYQKHDISKPIIEKQTATEPPSPQTTAQILMTVNTKENNNKEMPCNQNVLGIPNDCSLFLRKVYVMISTCDVEVAQWSDDGKFFIIKDTATFSNEVIPQFFKHNNIQSFVRQLNAYGFQKQRFKAKSIADLQSKNQDKCMYFCHKYFVRSHPELLRKIHPSRRRNSSSDQDEVETLKSEVNNMKELIKISSGEIRNLKSFVLELTAKLAKLERSEREESLKMKHAPKRRKIELYEEASTVASMESDLPFRVDFATTQMSHPSLTEQFLASNRDQFVNDTIHGIDNVKKRSFDPTEIWPDDLCENLDTFALIDTEDPDIIEAFMNDCDEEDIFIDNSFQYPDFEDVFECNNTKIHSVDPDIARKYAETIAILPKDMQHLFTKKQLFSNITNIDCLRKQVNEMFLLAMEVANSLKNKRDVPFSKHNSHNIISPRAA